ncbi:MAG: DUF935 family protein [Bacteroidota bacterium]|jgi:phage gp29-like protein|nr:DUF935 family protein [Bacteroidota bacterium]HHU96843.1 DUF935 family protein [Petrimonas sp.]
MAKQTNKQRQTVISQIVIKAPRRKTFDVGEWRRALISADAGRVKALYDLFEDLLIDGYLSDAFSKRKEAITNAELTFQNAKGEDVPEITTLMDTIAFENLLKLIMDVEGWGRTGVEFDFSDGLEVHEIPKKHINLVNKTILINDNDEVGIPYEGDDFLLILGEKRRYGLFMKTAPFVIWKRGGFGDWAQWLEIFGMPQRVGKYSMYDTGTRQILEQALANAGSAPYIVIPRETDVETVNNTGSGSSGASYGEFRKACNEEILITVLGQTLTTIQGDKGARSLGEVHKEVEESKNRADMRFVQRVLNQHVLPRLERRGFPVKGGRFVFPEAAEQLSVNELSTLSKILPIPRSYLYDKYSIPVPKDNEPVAGEKQPGQEDDGTSTGESRKEDEDEGKKTPTAKPKTKKRLRDFFALAPTKERGWLTRLTGSITGRVTLADKYSIDLRKLLQEALDEVYGNETTGREQPIVSKPLFNISNDALQQGLDTVFSDPGFGKKNQEFINEFRHNAAVFAAFKNHRQTGEIVALLHDEDGNLRSFREFKKLAQRVSRNYNENWLQTEYNTAVRAARNAVNFREWLETEHLYPNLEYVESTAAHPRASHLSYVGTVLPIRHPWWDKHIPPSAWNCACSVRPTDKDVTPVPGEEFVPPVFQNNPGKTAEFVKLKEHPYIKGVCPYFNTCLRRKPATQELAQRQLLDKSLKDGIDKTNPPVIPECAICEMAKKSALAKRREKLLNEMKFLYKKSVIRYVGSGKSIKIRFKSSGNRHLVDDYLRRVKGFKKKDLLSLDSLIREAEYVHSSKLYKNRDDNIQRFYYFKDTEREVYYNVAEEVVKLKNGRVYLNRFLYAITNTIPKK